MESSPFHYVPHTPLLDGRVPTQSPVPTVPDVDAGARLRNTPSPFQRRSRRTIDQCLPHTPNQRNARSGFQEQNSCQQTNIHSEQQVPQTPVGQSSLLWWNSRTPTTSDEPIRSFVSNNTATNTNNNANTCMSPNGSMDVTASNQSPVSIHMLSPEYTDNNTVNVHERSGVLTAQSRTVSNNGLSLAHGSSDASQNRAVYDSDRLALANGRVEMSQSRAMVHSTRQDILTSPGPRDQNTQELVLFDGDDYFA